MILGRIQRATPHILIKSGYTKDMRNQNNQDAMQTNIVKVPHKWLVRLVSLLWGVVLLPVSFMSMMSVMLFDAPGSETSVLTILLALSLTTAPLVLFVSCVGGLWISFSDRLVRKPRQAKILMLLPLINIIVFIIAFGLIEVVCNGELSC